MKYKVIVHRNKLSTRALHTQRDVENRRLAEVIYALISEYPGCSISLYPEECYIVTKQASISKQLEKLAKPSGHLGGSNTSPDGICTYS